MGTVEGVRRPTMRAQQLRREATPAERRLWQALSGSKLGHKFSRQMPVGPYICDFLCRTELLAVELDGESHAATVAYDEQRDASIRARNIRVLRFSNADVMRNLEGVVDAIRAALDGNAHPQPLPQAGGEL